eukprot:2386-Heterococcus_DN1.PRE.3
MTVTEQPVDTNTSDTGDTSILAVDGNECCDTERKAREAATETSTACYTDDTATTDITSAETELELVSTSATRMQVAACIDYVINTIQELQNRDHTDCVPDLYTSPQEIVTSAATSTSLVNNASFVETPTVSVGPTISPAPQSIATISVTATAEVSSVTSGSAAELCVTTGTTGVQDVANVCVLTTHSMLTNDDITTAPSHSDNSSACSSTQASSAATSSYTPAVATVTSASTTDAADLELGDSVSDCHDNVFFSDTTSTDSTDGATATGILNMKLSSLAAAADSSSVSVSDAHTITEQLNCNDSSVSTIRAAESSYHTVLTTNAAAANNTVSTQTADDTRQSNSIDSSMFDEGSSDLTVHRGCTNCSASINETLAGSSNLQYSDETKTNITSEATTANMYAEYMLLRLVVAIAP